MTGICLSPMGMDDLVQFQIAVYPVGTRGGVRPTYATTAPVSGYVETSTDAADRIEIAGPYADGRPIFKTLYRVFTTSNPSAGLARAVTVDDHVLWVNQSITLQILESPQPQAGIWLTQCVRVD